MNPRELVDEIDRRLAADEEVPLNMAANLLAAMPRAERERWLRTLVELAWRPDNIDP
ncbi:hypothetical protein [Pseudonocardia sp. D17]|uniref:hypothetical protein n=1 Tax=Pseudonocardia sp. D17 TaxID=882661 RepID=UPI002B3A1B40|nr:hypothetical protein PSD17_56520 [Pseudonocardia sp. D17]